MAFAAVLYQMLHYFSAHQNLTHRSLCFLCINNLNIFIFLTDIRVDHERPTIRFQPKNQNVLMTVCDELLVLKN